MILLEIVLIFHVHCLIWKGCGIVVLRFRLHEKSYSSVERYRYGKGISIC
jgi:hypothetical protein